MKLPLNTVEAHYTPLVSETCLDHPRVAPYKPMLHCIARASTQRESQ